MRRIILHLLFITLIIGTTLSVFTGCQGNKTDDVIIMLSNPGNDKFPLDDYFQVDRIVNVSIQGDFKPLSSNIKYVHIANQYAFIWDYDNLAISKVDMSTGVIVSQISGRSYSIMRGDEEQLYCQENFKNNIHILDLNLKEQGIINFDFIPAPSSFAKTKEGFIFLNTYNNKRKGRYIMTDDKCSKAISFLQSSKEEAPPPMIRGEGGRNMKLSGASNGKTVYPQVLFTPYSNGKIMCFDPENNKAYLCDGKKMEKLFQINTDNFNWETRAPYIIQINTVKDNKLIVYYYNWNYYLAYYNKKYDLIAHGLYGSSYWAMNTPLWQTEGNQFVTVVVPDEETPPGYPEKSVQAQIVFYSPR